MDATSIEILSAEECLSYLRAEAVGRIAFVGKEYPIVVPVNYRLVEAGSRVRLVLRTRPGNVIDRAVRVAFEVDRVDTAHRTGWSVLVQGRLRHLTLPPDADRAALDPQPWLADRDAWLELTPVSITGRRLLPQGAAWAFDPAAYL